KPQAILPRFSSTAIDIETKVNQPLEEIQNNEPDKLYKILELEIKGNDPAVLKSFCQFVSTAGNHLGVKSKTWAQFKPLHDRLTLLKSVHIYKKHRVQYEFRTYFRFVQFKQLTGSTADTLLEYIQRNLPEGVALKSTKVELHSLPDHLNSPAGKCVN
ncbi:28S ribosomal protein S10, mitochondrial-like, partial [Agrilus planipennis]